MTGFRERAFGGMIPRLATHNLPPGAAQKADNCRLLSTELHPFKDRLVLIHNTLRAGTVQTIFRMSNAGNSYWLSWTTDVDVVRSPVNGDTSQRIYYTGQNEPRASNLATAIGGGSGVMPAACFVLGVSPPTVAPTVGITGGAGATETRVYVETFRTPWGEESAPSPPKSFTGFSNATSWDLSALNAAPPNSYSISAAAWAGGVLSLTVNSVIGVRVGETITVTGLAPASLNTSHKIASINTGSKILGIALANNPGTITDGVGTAARDAPHNTAGMVRCIYRTYNGTYYYVGEVAVGTTTFTDTVTNADLVLNGELQSTDWDMPPADMTGLLELPGGMVAGFSGNELCLCEPWQPHAWPAEYRQSCSYPIVGIGAFGSSIVVCTATIPYIVTGSHPASMSMEKGRGKAPCLSKRSVVGVGDGVLYSCPDGLAFENGGPESLETGKLFTRDEWTLLNPSSLQCTVHNGMVFGWHTVNAELRTGFAWDRLTNNFVSLSMTRSACYVDPETGEMYVVDGSLIYQWDAHPYNNLSYDWHSRDYLMPRPVNFSYGIVEADYDASSGINEQIAADLEWNTTLMALANAEADYCDVNMKGTVDAHLVDEFMVDGSNLRGGSMAEYTPRTLRMTVYADGVYRYTEILLSNKAFTIPAGFKGSRWRFEISGNMPVRSFVIAESAREFGSIP